MSHGLTAPLYVLVDYVPWGYYVHSVLKQGSINLAFESQRMAIPAAHDRAVSVISVRKLSPRETKRRGIRLLLGFRPDPCGRPGRPGLGRDESGLSLLFLTPAPRPGAARRFP